ncbi:MAG: TolC family protein [Ignavibacteriaceae bacterium]|nr:TolC family protein [Ignavibacterium sp.]MCC6254364.1 TolC family protein [Ignavibacteriaceae bacterium]HRN25560.1 TolC family protein [Ignavibacteriaceae bacterium]HRP92354.1 TolC family protein [Ignavibacteriaceae bacterium]HRQ53097.1 TolC family protein [Ignavibacteriaceae bacterium]
MKHKTPLIPLNIFISFILVFAIQFSTSAQSKVYTLDEAINTALSNNRDVTISVMNVKKAEAAVDEAFGYALPSLDLSGSFSHFLEKPKMSFPDFGSLLQNATYSILFDEHILPRDENKFKAMQNVLQSFAQTNNYSTSLTLSQTLFSSAVFKGIGASRIYYDLAKADLNSTVSKTVLSVQKTFYGVLLSKEVLDITRQSFENAEANLNDVKALYREGLVSEFDMLQAEVQVENIRPVVLQMENNLQSAKDGLKIILGINQNDDIDVAGEFVYKPYDISNEEELINEALVSNFEIKTLDLKKQVDEAFIQLDVANYWPNIAAFGQYTYAGSSDNWKFNNYSSATIGINFSMNLWQGNRTKNAVQQSTITYQQTDEQLKQLKDYTLLNVKVKLQELRRVQTVIDAQNRNVEVAQRAYDIAKVRYKEGAGSQIELQNTDLALKQARLNRIQSMYSYLITKYELDQILGKTNQDYFLKFEE